MAKELYTTNDAAVSNRPKFAAAKHLGYNHLMFGFGPHGQVWREMRRITTSELLSNRRVELLKDVRISEVDASLKDLYKLWKDKRKSGKWSDHVLVEFREWFGDLTLNVILRMIAGKKYVGAGATCDEEEARRCRAAFRELSHFLGLFVLRDAVPFLGWLDFGGHEKAMKRTAKELDGIVGKWLEEHRWRMESGKVASEEQDFMDVLISALEGGKELVAGYSADNLIKSTCLNLILGGNDTTKVTLTWVLALLLNHDRVLKKAQEELDTIVGKERLVNESDISKLTYLQAIVKETLRLYPAAPLAGPRETMEDCAVGGYHVKKGTRVITNLWKIQTDPRVWPNPLHFNPERFITTHKHVDVKGQHFELIPFGSGRRACPGTSLSLQFVHLTLARLLQAFELSNPSDALVDMSESPGLANMKASPLEVLVAPRLPPELYV